MAKKSIPLSSVYKFIEPGPVVIVTTSYKGKEAVDGVWLVDSL